MEKWHVKNYMLKNGGIGVFENYHNTDREWKKSKRVMCTKDTFQKIFWKIEDFSRYLDWNFGETMKEYEHTSFSMYEPQKNYYQLYPQKTLTVIKKYITLWTVTKKWELTLDFSCKISNLLWACCCPCGSHEVNWGGVHGGLFWSIEDESVLLSLLDMRNMCETNCTCSGMTKFVHSSLSMVSWHHNFFGLLMGYCPLFNIIGSFVVSMQTWVISVVGVMSVNLDTSVNLNEVVEKFSLAKLGKLIFV